MDIQSYKIRLFHFIKKVSIWIQNIWDTHLLSSLKQGNYYGYSDDIIGVSQLCDPKPELVTAIYGEINDPEAAKRFGTKDLKEYSFWAWRACGIANVATVLKTLGHYDGTLYQLVKEVDSHGGYLHDGDIGWKHQALADSLGKYGLNAASTPLSLNRMLYDLSQGVFVIASTQSRIAGGHMLLVIGFTWLGEETRLKIYDPYNLDHKGGEREITLQEFKHLFRNRGIVVKFKHIALK